jgi:hypothetical protein
MPAMTVLADILLLCVSAGWHTCYAVLDRAWAGRWLARLRETSVMQLYYLWMTQVDQVGFPSHGVCSRVLHLSASSAGLFAWLPACLFVCWVARC